MKKILLILMLCIFTVGCSSSSKVERIDADTVVDLSGNWNDADVRLVAKSLVDSCLNDSPAIRNYTTKNRKPPVVIIGTIKNNSDEHIDTSILAKQLEAALVNSGEVDFVANAYERDEIRAERNDQQRNASMATAAQLANETGADFMLIGAVKTMVDSNGKDMVRSYFVSAELIDIETNRKLWVGENSEIKKYISRSNVRM